MRGQARASSAGHCPARGCMVGPDYTKPSVPMTPATRRRRAARPHSGRQRPRGQCGQSSASELHALERRSHGNQNLKVAEPGARSPGHGPLNGPRCFPHLGRARRPVPRDSSNRPSVPSVEPGQAGDLLCRCECSYEIDLWGRVRRRWRRRVTSPGHRRRPGDRPAQLQAELAMTT